MMENYISDLEAFASKITQKKRPYMEGNSDKEAVRSTYIKWMQLKSVVDLPDIPEDVINSLDQDIRKAFDETFKERPDRQKVSNLLSSFIKDFRKHIIVERKIKGKPIELDWEDPVSHFETYGITKEFEEGIRKFIKTKLKEKYGDKWLKEGVPKEIRKEWRNREERDKNEAKVISENVDYASFGDYFEVIKFNWKEIFKEMFGDKEKARIRFNDINNLIRKPAAHMRTIDPDEVGHAKFTKRWIESKIGRELENGKF